MGSLPLIDFTGLVRFFAAAAQAAAATALDFTLGSFWRALAEANASVSLWVQWLIYLVLQQTRLSTCFGPAVDSFVADYGVTRLPAVASSGPATFSRVTYTSAATIPVGFPVRTFDGSQTFLVLADATNSYWNASLNAFVIPAGTQEITVTVQAQVAGTAGNVGANTVTLLAQAIAYVDSVTNAAGFVNGIDAESDAALKARFQGYIESREAGTVQAIKYAAQSVQQGLYVQVLENTPANGFFTVVVDDGTGSPPSSLLTSVATAVDPVRAVGTTPNVVGPTLVNVTVELTLTCAPGTVKANLIGPVAQAETAYVNSLTEGATLPISIIAAIAYGQSAGIVNVTNVTLNGGTVDLVPPNQMTVYRIASVVVS